MAWTSNELIASSGGDFATISLFEADHDGDTPTNGTLCQGRIKGNTDSTNCYWTGWQSGQNATTRIVLTAESGSETDGTDGGGDDAVVDTVQYLIENTNALYIDFTRIEVNGSFISINLGSVGQVRIARCFFRNHTISAIYTGGTTSDVTLKIGTCLFKASGTNTYQAAVNLNDPDITTTVEIYNCTMYGCTDGIAEVYGSCKSRNNVGANNSSSDFSSVSDIDYCASEDSTATGANSVTGITPANEWATPATDGTGDFTIKDTDSDIYHSGEARAESWFTDLCATDLAGTTWNDPPSMGCFEFVADSGVTGTAAQTVASVTQAATGAVSPRGTAAQTVAAQTQAATGVLGFPGTAAQTVAEVSQSASGVVANPVTGTAAQTVAAVEQAATGVEGIPGTAGQTVAAQTQSASGSVANPITGTAAQTVANVTQSASGTVGTGVTGTAAQTVSEVSQSATGIVANPVTGTAAQTLAAQTQSATGIIANPITGTAAQTVESVEQAATGVYTAPVSPRIPEADLPQGGLPKIEDKYKKREEKAIKGESAIDAEFDGVTGERVAMGYEPVYDKMEFPTQEEEKTVKKDTTREEGFDMALFLSMMEAKT